MVREKQIEVTKIVITALPEKLQSLTIEQVITHVNTCQEKRSELQSKIKELSAKRQAYIDAEMAKRQLTGENAFDMAVRTAIRERAREKGFRFPGDGMPGAASPATLHLPPVAGLLEGTRSPVDGALLIAPSDQHEPHG